MRMKINTAIADARKWIAADIATSDRAIPAKADVNSGFRPARSMRDIPKIVATKLIPPIMTLAESAVVAVC